jgi:hypothetical protein
MCQAQCIYIHFVRKHAVQFNTEYFIVATYIRNKSYKKCQTKFTTEFPGTSVPSKSTIHEMAHKFTITGSVLNKKWQKTQCDVFDSWGGHFKHLLSTMPLSSTYIHTQTHNQIFCVPIGQ